MMSTSTLTRNLQESRLANGMHAFIQPNALTPRIAMNLYLPGGNLLELKPGMQDVIDRLVTKGTESLSQEAFSIAIDSLSLEVDAETRRDYSIVSATLLPEDWHASMALIADLFYNASMAEFSREKERMAGEITMDLDAPRTRAADRLGRTVFADSPYGVVGSVILENLPNLELPEECLRHYHQVYRPDRALVSLAGPLPPSWQDDLQQYFPQPDRPVASLASGTEDRLRSHVITERRIVHTSLPDSSQCHIFEGWLLPEATHEDYIPLGVMNTILGGAGLSSRMFTELRDKQGLAYHVRSSLDVYRHRGLISLYIGTEASNRERCLEGFRVECAKLMQELVPDWELTEAKQNVIGRRALSMETVQQQVGMTGATVMLGRPLSWLENYEARVQAVSAEDVQRVAQTYLSKPSIVSLAGPNVS